MGKIKIDDVNKESSKLEELCNKINSLEFHLRETKNDILVFLRHEYVEELCKKEDIEFLYGFLLYTKKSHSLVCNYIDLFNLLEAEIVERCLNG